MRVPSGKIGRWGFAASNVVMNGFVLPLIQFFGTSPNGDRATDAFGVWILPLSVLVSWIFLLGLPRCRDAGLPWWILLLLLVPIVNLGVSLMLVGTGTKPVGASRTEPVDGGR